jgi:hypothetical protein
MAHGGLLLAQMDAVECRLRLCLAASTGDQYLLEPVLGWRTICRAGPAPDQPTVPGRTRMVPLEEINTALGRLRDGGVVGRLVVTPWTSPCPTTPQQEAASSPGAGSGVRALGTR